MRVAPSAYAATLYVDGNLSGNCSGNYSISNRTCSGSDGNAYTDVTSGVSAASAGDTIYIREGTYTTSSSININFSSDSTTTIQGYGSESITIHKTTIAGALFNLGTAKNVLFKNMNLTGIQYIVDTGWTNYSGNVWTAPSQCSTQIRFDTTNGTSVGSIGAVVSANQYYCSDGIIYVYSVGDPTTTYTSPGINVADNFDAIGIGNPSVNAAGNLITIDNVTFDSFAHVGVKGTWRWHVLNSKFTNIGTDGNDHDIYDPGIQTSGNESVYEYNYFGYVPGYGIHFYSSPTYAIVRYNVFNGHTGSNTGSGGILLGGTDDKIYNNTFYGWSYGIYFYKSGSQNNIVENNIFSNNFYDVGIDAGGSSYPTNNTFTNNYLGSNTKCGGCSDYTGSGGPNYSAFVSASPNTYSTSPWTNFTYTFTYTGGANSLMFFNACGGGANPSSGVWYLDDISITPVVGGSEEVTNGGMEGVYSSGLAPNWNSGGGISIVQSTSTVHSGSSAQEVTIGGGCGMQINQNVPLTAGNAYVLSGWAKRDTGTGTLPVYLPTGGGNTSFTIGTLDPSFLGTLPYSSATDFKLSNTQTDASLLINSGANLGTNNQLGWDSSATIWPLTTINQNLYGTAWDLGPFVYTPTPISTDNTDSLWHTNNVTITLSCSESNGTGCSHTYYTTDGSIPTTVSNSGTNISLTNDGTYTIKYFSTDTLGNQESVKTASNTVKIDKTAPSAGSLLSVTGYSNSSTQPTLVFKKSTDATSGIASYSVSLDSGKNRSFSVAGIPASGNGSSDYIWRDDSSTKVEFLYEDDSDPTNDEIHVYFKGLNITALSEGKHTWSVTTYDNSGNSTIQSQDFYIDRTSPSLSDVAIANVSIVQPGGNYNLSITNRMPSFSGLATDSYQGSTVTNSDGSTDMFDKISSGPQTITLTLQKQNEDKLYSTYLIQNYPLSVQKDDGTTKSNRFYITTPFPLVDGYYKVNIILSDVAGNTFTQPDFYLSINNSKLLAPLANLLSNNLQINVFKETTVPATTSAEKQQVQQNGSIVNIKVVNAQNQPVVGAKVTIHSKVQTTTTDKNGMAIFTNVEPGQHTVQIAYSNYQGGQEIKVSGDVKEYNFDFTVKPDKYALSQLAYWIIGGLVIALGEMALLLIKKTRKV